MDNGQERFPNLRHLSLPSTSLITFPSLSFDSLTSLDLSHNLLNEIPPLPPTLTSLNLSHNLITSVRNAKLGNVRSCNLSNNRIDCLAGLDADSLQRIDVRRNELAEHGEIGRLAILPSIKQVWCADNTLTTEQDWRVKLGVTFAAEGRDVIIDDADWTWGERRAIDARLAASGQSRPKHGRTPTMPAQLADRQTARIVTMPATPAPTEQSPISTRQKQKRRPRRVIDLDGQAPSGTLSVRGSQIPEDANGRSEILPKQRSRLKPDTFEAP